MAVIGIPDLQPALTLNDTDLFVIDQNGEGKKLQLSLLRGSIGSDTGATFYLSNYAGSSIYVEDAWAILLATIPMGYIIIVVDANPNTVNGSWEMRSPCRVPNNCTLDLGHTLIIWNNQSTTPVTKRITGMFYAIGTVSSQTTITADIIEGSSVVTVADASSIEADSYIYIDINNNQDQTTTASQFPLIYMYFKVKKVVGNDVYFRGKINWDVSLADQDTYTVSVVKYVDCAKNITVLNANILDEGLYVAQNVPPRLTDNPQPDYVIGPFFFQYCDNIKLSNLYGKHLKCPLVQIREGTRCLAEDCYSDYPLAINSGEGYTVTMSRGSYYFQFRNGGNRTRHVGDFTSVYYGVMKDCWDDTEKGDVQPYTTVSFYIHGRYDSEIIMDNLTTKNAVGIATGGFVGFGNWLKHFKLTNSRIGQFGGRGAVGDCVIENTDIGEVLDTMFFEKVTFSNVNIATSLSQIRLEHRLPVVSPLNGAYITNGSKIRFSVFQEFDRVVIEDSCYHRLGGSIVQPVYVNDVKSFTCGGEHLNRRYVLTGGCEKFTLPSNASLNFSNATGEDGAITITDITSDELVVSLNGSISSELAVIGTTMHRPLHFKKGTGVAYDLRLNVNGCRIEGLWGGVGKVSNDIGVVSGSAEGNYYEGVAALNYFNNGTNGRLPWPVKFISCGNNYSEEARNFDNVNRTFVTSVDFGLVPANTEQGVVVPPPIWMDITKPAYVHASFSGIIPNNADIIAGVRTTPNDFFVRARNFAATTQNIGAVNVAFNYSLIKS